MILRTLDVVRNMPAGMAAVALHPRVAVPVGDLEDRPEQRPDQSR